jgi:hypothetical protein
MFVLFGAELKTHRRSSFFSFEGSPVEFCCGLEHSADAIVVSYGIMDKKAVVAAFDADGLSDLICYDVVPGDLDALCVAREGVPSEAARIEALERTRDTLLEELYLQNRERSAD